MRQYFSNAADPVPVADDAAAVPAADRVAAPAVPAADAAAISNAACVAAPLVVSAAACTSRCPDIPEALSDVPLSLDEEMELLSYVLHVKNTPRVRVLSTGNFHAHEKGTSNINQCWNISKHIIIL